MAMFLKPSYEAVESSFWRKPKLISVQMEDHMKNKTIRAMHVHDDRVEIILICSGHGLNTVGGKLYNVGEGDILIYNAGTVHDEYTDTQEGMNIMWCIATNIQFGQQPDNILVPKGCTPVLHQAECFEEARALMTMLMSMQDPEVQYHLLCALLLMLRSEALRREDTGLDKNTKLSHQIQQYIDEHYLEDIRLEEIAAHVGKDPSYLSRVFRKTVGYSPIQYAIRRRIGQAQSWLLMTDKTVTEIAFLVGYNSVGNFHAAFLKTVGMTPQKYRELWSDHPKT